MSDLSHYRHDSGTAHHRVCLVAPAIPPVGGMSLQAKMLAECLRQGGLECEVLPTNPRLPALVRFVAGIPGLRSVFQLAVFFRRALSAVYRSEVVHHFGASGLYFFLGTVPLVAICAVLRRRLVITYHGGKAAEFLHHWEILVVPVLAQASVFCVPSAFLQRIFAEYGLKAEVLPNVVDTAGFHYRRRERFAPRLIVTRHLEPMYGVDTILRAFRIILGRYPGAQLLVVGSGSEARRLQALAEEWGLAQASFAGSVAPERMPELYDEYDIFVNASRVDNFPGAVVEAACSGLPIVTSCAGGIEDMIQQEVNGLLVPVDDHRALAEEVVRIVDNPELGCRLAAAARAWAEQFSAENAFARALECYGFKTDGQAAAATAAHSQAGVSS